MSNSQEQEVKKALPVNRIAQTVTTVLLILSTIFCFFVVTSSAMKKDVSIFGHRLFYVVSGSMEPTIPIGAMMIVGACDEYAVDDIITFYSEETGINGYPNTHRIIDIYEENGKTFYITKGDANNTPDISPVAHENVIGKVKFSLNGTFFSKIIEFIGTPAGFFGMVLLPILIVAVICMRSFKKVLGEEIRKAALESLEAEQVKTEECHENETEGNDTTE